MTISLTEQPGIRWGITDRDFPVCADTSTTARTAVLSARHGPTRQIKFQFADGELTVVVDQDPPAWLVPTARALVDLLNLPSGWDSYGAARVAPSHVRAALQFLSCIMRDDSPTPAVVPTNRGGVQLEWHTGGIDLEIETLSTQRLLVSFEDANSGAEWEREIVSDFTPLIECVEQLS